MRKLKKALTKHFPPPGTVRLEGEDGVIGIVASTRFEGMDSIDRVDLIGSILEASLTPEERHQIQIIVGVTPDEATFYEAVNPRRRGLPRSS